MRAPIVLCGDCKHWEGDACPASKGLPEEVGRCMLISDSYLDAKALAKTSCFYSLETKPTFGCVLGDKK